MKSIENHYATLLGISTPWYVGSVDLDLQANRLTVKVQYEDNASVKCPECGKSCPRYDWREERSWRHLDTMQFETILVCQVPRCNCSDHGVKTVKVPWAEKNSGFTLMFESFAIKVLQSCSSVKSACELLKINWHQCNDIRKRGVERGLERREEEMIDYLGIDEKSFGKGHNYISTLTDLYGGRVLEVSQGRSERCSDLLFESLSRTQKAVVKAVAMDMWKPFMNSVMKCVPYAQIVHDRFHVSKHLGEAVDKVRKSEHKKLMGQKDETLKGSKYLWLQGIDNMTDEAWKRFESLQALGLKVGRAWSIKHTFEYFWSYRHAGYAKRFFDKWYGWARRSKLKPIKEKAKTLKSHFSGLISYVKHRISNATTEGLNGKIQNIKANARGFRDFENYRMAILFHCGKLDMLPQ